MTLHHFLVLLLWGWRFTLLGGVAYGIYLLESIYSAYGMAAFRRDEWRREHLEHPQ